MKKTTYFLAMVLLLGLISAFANEVTCESNDNRRKECSIDTRGGVRIIRQLSNTACIEGRTWGASRNSVWVDDGCRAVFASGSSSSSGNSGNYNSSQVTCESNDNRRKECSMNTRGGVRLIRQLSDTACIQGRNWGTNQNSVWVDDGCRAVFASGSGSSSGNSGNYSPNQVTCESNDNRRKECSMNTRGGVRLIRQLSDTACIQGRNWGTYQNSVWVDNGCRAVFASGSGSSSGNSGNYSPSQVTCESNDNGRKSCSMDTQGGVRLIRQLSNAACIEGRTWGYGRNSVWVDNGCRAVFSSGR